MKYDLWTVIMVPLAFVLIVANLYTSCQCIGREDLPGCEFPPRPPP